MQKTKIIVGRVRDIDDIMSFHGESVAEFKSNFHAAIEDYLAASNELGSAAEKPVSGKFRRSAPSRWIRSRVERIMGGTRGG